MDIRNIFGVLTSKKTTENEKQRAMKKLERREDFFYNTLNRKRNINNYGKTIRYDNIKTSIVDMKLRGVPTLYIECINGICIVSLNKTIELCEGTYKECKQYIEIYIEKLESIKAPDIMGYLEKMGFEPEKLGKFLKTHAIPVRINVDPISLDIQSVEYGMVTWENDTHKQIVITKDEIIIGFPIYKYLFEEYGIYMLIRNGYRSSMKSTEYWSDLYENKYKNSNDPTNIKYWVNGNYKDDIILGMMKKRDGNIIYIEPFRGLELTYGDCSQGNFCGRLQAFHGAYVKLSKRYIR